MQINGISQVHGPHSLSGPRQQYNAQPAARPSGSQPVDQLDISTAAQMLSQAREAPAIRQDVVNRIRGEIANGTYETADKLDIALDRLLNEIG